MQTLQLSDIPRLFEDDDIVAFDKPFGLVVNTSSTSGEVTLQSLVSEEVDILEDSSDEFISRGGIVHRLDKDTSGILLVAKTQLAFERLQEEFKNREVTKEYLALVLGKLEDSKFEVDAPIGRNPKNRFKFAVVEGGKESLTLFEKDSEITIDDSIYTFVKAFPKTGRTHQIRVHLAALGHPIAGDSTYSSVDKMDKLSPQIMRLMLHAHKLKFIHPTSGESIELVSPLPDDFTRLYK